MSKILSKSKSGEFLSLRIYNIPDQNCFSFSFILCQANLGAFPWLSKCVELGSGQRPRESSRDVQSSSNLCQKWPTAGWGHKTPSSSCCALAFWALNAAHSVTWDESGCEEQSVCPSLQEAKPEGPCTQLGTICSSPPFPYSLWDFRQMCCPFWALFIPDC